MLAQQRSATAIPAVLLAAGLVGILATAGTGALALLVGWLIVATAYVVVQASLAGRRRTRVVVAAASCLIVIAATWEGGLFMLPAAVASLVLAVRA